MQILHAILVLRRQRVILDRDLARLYGVTTKRFNEAAKRNTARFPQDFMFQLSAEETAVLRSQIATSKIALKDGRGGARYRPFAFTEHGAIQTANILNSERAVSMGVYVVRAFVQLREALASNKMLARKLASLESSLSALDIKTQPAQRALRHAPPAHEPRAREAPRHRLRRQPGREISARWAGQPARKHS